MILGIEIWVYVDDFEMKAFWRVIVLIICIGKEKQSISRFGINYAKGL